MSNNIETINDYKKGDGVISGDFLLYNGSGISCANNNATEGSKISIPAFITESNLPPNKPCITLDFTGTNLYWIFPCLSDYGGNLCFCAANYNESGGIQSNINGTFNVTFRVRGVIETTGTGVWGNPGTYIQPYVQKNPSGYTSDNNVYSLIIGSDTYVLNYGDWNGELTVLDYLLTIPLNTNQSYSLNADSVDGVETKNYDNLIASDDDPNNPIRVQQPYPGQFMQIDLINWSYGAATKNNSCIPNIYGCTDSSATNYNPYATINDGTCFYAVTGCPDPSAANYNPNANVPTPCTYIGTLDAYIGFTSATGTWDAYHIVHNLKFTNDIMTLDYSSGFDTNFSYNGTAYLDVNGNSFGCPASASGNGYDYTGIINPGNTPRSAVLTNPWGDGTFFYVPGIKMRNNVSEPVHNFSINYSFTITPDIQYGSTADGIVFVIQSLSYGVGGGGGGIGYDGITKSIGVKHDDWCNGGPEICENIDLTPYGYPSNNETANYVGVVENGNIYSHGDSYISCSSLPGSLSLPFVYADGRTTYVWVDYIDEYWYVYLSKTNTKPSTPLLNGYHMPLGSNNIFS